MHVPEDRRYTEEHEWALVEDGGKVRVGITDYAQEALGDVVFVDLPAVGRRVAAGERLAEIESTKSVAEVYAPVTGVITLVNEALATQPELVNRAPYGEGWLIVLAADEPYGPYDNTGLAGSIRVSRGAFRLCWSDRARTWPRPCSPSADTCFPTRTC